MFCKKCGNQLKEGELFCPNCGQKKEEVNESVVINKEVVNSDNSKPLNVDNSNTKGNSKAPLILGIFAVLFSPIFIISLPLAIVGLVQYKKNKKFNSNFNIAGKVLSIIGIVLTSIITIILAILVFFGVFLGISEAVNDFDKRDSYYSERLENTKRVGKTDYGYINVPSSWKLISLSAPYSYSDKNNNEVLTMFEYSDYQMDLNSAVEYVKQSAFESSEHYPEENIEYIDGYRTIELSWYEADYNKYVEVTLFEDENGVIHYIALESTDEDSDVFDLIDTYRLYD